MEGHLNDKSNSLSNVHVAFHLCRFAPDDDNDEQMDYGELPPTSETMSGFPGFGASAMGRLPMGQFAIANPVYDQFVNEDDQTIEEAGL